MNALVFAIASAAAVLAVLGIVQCAAGLAAAIWFAVRPLRPPATFPPVTILKPLCGDEPLLEEALASCCRQSYPEFQMVFGVQDLDDPALAVVERVRARFPDCDITVIADRTLHGPNRKIANLINMLPAAKHNLLVFSDSDLHVAPNYLERLVAALQQPKMGLVSTLYVGLPGGRGWVQRLGATQISHVFLPGALLARAFGRQDCLGNTMILRRSTLERIGGLRSLVTELADDNVLGQRVRDLGLRVGLADIVTAATVPEASRAAIWQHEIRWARTIRNLAPVGFATSAIQYPIFWAALAAVFSLGAFWSLGLLAAAWAMRGVGAMSLNRILRHRLSRPAAPMPFWLLPLRDFLSVIEILASYASNRVVWRGHIVHSGSHMASGAAE
jgi:ceramide glucosyltransferase